MVSYAYHRFFKEFNVKNENEVMKKYIINEFFSSFTVDSVAWTEKKYTTVRKHFMDWISEDKLKVI
jgi:hypothetical protein